MAEFLLQINDSGDTLEINNSGDQLLILDTEAAPAEQPQRSISHTTLDAGEDLTRKKRVQREKQALKLTVEVRVQGTSRKRLKVEKKTTGTARILERLTYQVQGMARLKTVFALATKGVARQRHVTSAKVKGTKGGLKKVIDILRQAERDLDEEEK